VAFGDAVQAITLAIAANPGCTAVQGLSVRVLRIQKGFQVKRYTHQERQATLTGGLRDGGSSRLDICSRGKHCCRKMDSLLHGLAGLLISPAEKNSVIRPQWHTWGFPSRDWEREKRKARPGYANPDFDCNLLCLRTASSLVSG
jgi:hypothetical protein